MCELEGGFGIVCELDEKDLGADVGGHPTDLEGLESGPGENTDVVGAELAEVLGQMRCWAVMRHSPVPDVGELRSGVMAQRLVGWPVLALTVGRAVLCNETAAADAESAGDGGFHLATGSADAKIARFRAGSRAGVMGMHYSKKISRLS